MSSPYGLAFTGTNGLLVSDQAYNRVLYFPFSGNGTFAAGTDNGKVATKVFGEPDFQTVAAGSTDASLSSPHHISCDTNGQLYVADSGNNRIIIFGDPNSAQTATGGQPSVLSINNLASPEGVYVNPSTGEIWVANTRNATAVRYPKFETLLFNQTPIDANPIEAPSFTLAVAQDQFGDLVLADGANRVEFYYPGLYGLNGASFETDKNLAPGMIATIFPLPATGTTMAATFGSTTATNTGST
jgi:DNA-binding beta-propeller fold protein YncE